MRGVSREDIRLGLHVTYHKGRTVIAYAVDENARTVSILGVLYGGQDFEGSLSANSACGLCIDLLRRSCDPVTGSVELALQTFDNDVGIDILTCTACFIPGAQPARNELRLDAAPLDASTHRRFNEGRDGFALGQH